MALEKLPRVKLANLPTPMESLSRFSEMIGGGPKLFIKRDDLTGFAGEADARQPKVVTSCLPLIWMPKA